eukprot:1390593-Amorphochlora_amoeboformis.AAC.1
MLSLEKRIKRSCLKKPHRKMCGKVFCCNMERGTHVGFHSNQDSKSPTKVCFSAKELDRLNNGVAALTKTRLKEQIE